MPRRGKRRKDLQRIRDTSPLDQCVCFYPFMYFSPKRKNKTKDSLLIIVELVLYQRDTVCPMVLGTVVRVIGLETLW